MVRLKIGKAMFGAKVFLNGKPVVENWISFSPTYADLAGLVKGKGETNELVVRVGAHIESLPPTVCTGGEIEKEHYIPGIYDRVELVLSGNPYVVRAEVVPDPQRSEARVAVWLANASRGEAATELCASVYEWQSSKLAARPRHAAFDSRLASSGQSSWPFRWPVRVLGLPSTRSSTCWN